MRTGSAESLAPSESVPQAWVCLVGLESVGKSTLLQSLTGAAGRSEAMRGSTLQCEWYRDAESGISLVDTPGLVRECDSASAQETLSTLSSLTECLLVVRALSAVDELQILWPLVRRKRVAVVLTNRDLVLESPEEQAEKLEQWRELLGVPVALVNARELKESEKAELRRLVQKAALPDRPELKSLPDWLGTRNEPQRVFLDNPVAALFLLFGPIFAAVYSANSLADAVQPWLDLPTGETESVLGEIIFGPYGLVGMLPFLLLYALPTIVFFTFVLSLYKSSGLLDRLSRAIHPVISPSGLGGRDAVRVIMGFGCNVPAVVATRACHSCTRGACVSAIAFGAACSYQLPATLAVFSAAGQPGLVLLYMLVLLGTTALYLRFTSPKKLRVEGKKLLLDERNRLHPVNIKQAFRDTKAALAEFIRMALPVFVLLCVGASLLHLSGALSALTEFSKPAMALFNLPPEAATAVILGSIRKDGIAIGLLEPSMSALRVPAMTSGQLLTSVYLSGLFLPCLVTLAAIARELGINYAARLALKQASWASIFSVCLAWIFYFVKH